MGNGTPAGAKPGKTLVMMGLGVYDFAQAAAVALKACRTPAQLTCTSAARLPGRMAECAADKTPPAAIQILGIGLSAAPNELGAALAELAKRGTRVTWFSKRPLPDNLPAAVTDNLEAKVDVGAELFKVVADALGADAAFIGKLPKDYRDLFEASQYAYRNYGDSEPYHSVVRHMAASDAKSLWTDGENRNLEFYRQHGARELSGKSAAITKLKERIRKIAPFKDTRVLILGESGTGKETIALQIHQLSPRNTEPMIPFNCASVSPELLESRFLGYEKGAFTGANECKPGIFELADGGTLFLDEVGELPLAAQGVLLRILEEGRFYRMSGKEEVKVDVRVISATNRDLVKMVADGTFREDLYFRLSVIELTSPSLRDRREDIGKIAESRWRKLGHGPLTDAQVEALSSYDWPGNVRELMNLVERAHVLGEDFSKLVEGERAKMLPAAGKRDSGNDLPDNLDAATARHVRRVFEKYGHVTGKAAAALGISPNTLRKYLDM